MALPPQYLLRAPSFRRGRHSETFGCCPIVFEAAAAASASAHAVLQAMSKSFRAGGGQFVLLLAL